MTGTPPPPAQTRRSPFAALLSAYVGMQLAYCISLKHVLVVDLVVVTTGPEHIVTYQNPTSTKLFGPRQLGVPMVEAFPELSAEGRSGRLRSVTVDGARHECDLLIASGAPQPAYSLLSQAGARIVYDPERGTLKWRRTRPAEHFANITHQRNWMTRHAGRNAYAGMGVEGYGSIVFRAESKYLINIFRQNFDRYGSIFNEAQGFLFTLHSQHEAESFFPKVPYVIIFLPFRE